jgi:hypothetical protein
MHEKERRRMTRGKFFLIALICSFAWYIVPGYLFPTLTAISWVCWVYPKSITMQQIGSGLNGLGVGALTLDWSVVASFLGSPLVSPFFATASFLGSPLVSTSWGAPSSRPSTGPTGWRVFPVVVVVSL